MGELALSHFTQGGRAVAKEGRSQADIWGNRMPRAGLQDPEAGVLGLFQEE